MYQPYPYQIESHDALAQVRRKGKNRALVVMASGLGKTVTAAFDARRWLSKHGGRLLYLCHQNDILEQAQITFKAILGGDYSFGYFHGQEKSFHRVDCLFASFQTMQKKRKRFRKNEFSYIVVDESHHGQAATYRPTLDYFKPKFLLGITATPERSDLKDIREIYGEEIFSLPLEDALSQGLLTPVDYYVVTDELQDLKILDTSIGRLSVKEINRKVFIPRRDDEIAKIILRKIDRVPNPRVMIFCPSISYCDRLSTHVPYSIPIHSRLSVGEQRARLDAFRSGLVNIVLTVDKFNEGIDIPEANVVVFLRSTASRMVFYQQLGRGLRKVPGKKRVLVLDFVANCDKLQMIQRLWRSVKRSGKYMRKVGEDKPLSIDIGKVRFTEVAKRILKVLAAIRVGYTKEVLVKQLLDLYQKLGRTPMQEDVKKASGKGECASTSTFSNKFGSFNAALEAAGLEVVYRRYSKQELIQQLRSLYQELGRVPIRPDMEKALSERRCASVTTFKKSFGSWGKAVKAAGLTVVPKRKRIIAFLVTLAKELGKTPSVQDVIRTRKRNRAHPSLSAITTEFKYFSAALEAAGLRVFHRRYSERQLTQQLKKLGDEIGRRPYTTDIIEAHRKGKCASIATFFYVFDSLDKALRRAGFVPSKTTFTRDELLRQLRKLHTELGDSPRARDIDKACKEGKSAHSRTFSERFGSIPNALKEAHLPIPFSKEVIIRQLRSLAKELGRTPMGKDVKKAHREGKSASLATITSKFDTFSAALKASGLPLVYVWGYTRAELVKQLCTLRDELDRIPRAIDVKKARKAGKSAGIEIFRKKFGSFPVALKAAGMSSWKK